MAWVQRPSGLIKSGRKHKYFLRGAALIKVDNVHGSKYQYESKSISDTSNYLLKRMLAHFGFFQTQTQVSSCLKL
jgi:hypothetical protein